VPVYGAFDVNSGIENLHIYKAQGIDRNLA
jgi:hypothetical protein